MAGDYEFLQRRYRNHHNGDRGYCNSCLAGASQWYSTKLMTANQPKQVEENPTSDMMKSMNVTMPLMSVFFCFTFASGIGIYWVAQSVFTVIQQMVINSYLNKVDMERAGTEKCRKD